MCAGYQVQGFHAPDTKVDGVIKCLRACFSILYMFKTQGVYNNKTVLSLQTKKFRM